MKGATVMGVTVRVTVSVTVRLPISCVHNRDPDELYLSRIMSK